MQALRRALCTSGAALRAWSSAAAAPAQSVFEMREYTLHPAGVKQFLQLSAEYAALRASLNPGFRGCAAAWRRGRGAWRALTHAARSFFVCDTGGVLNRVTHFYAYESLAQRASVRQALAADRVWQH